VSNPALAALDARIVRTFKATGVADSATLNGAACDVMIDRNVQVFGDNGEIVGPRDVATFLRSEVAPMRGGMLVVGSDTWTLEKKTTQDESLSEWILNHV